MLEHFSAISGIAEIAEASPMKIDVVGLRIGDAELSSLDSRLPAPEDFRSCNLFLQLLVNSREDGKPFSDSNPLEYEEGSLPDMVLDYSKWDALELSDDSDIEVHPNVDKRSFIRAKQNQIHQQRFERRHQIETLKYERVVNDGLLERIDALLASLKKHEKDAKNASGPDVFMMQALMESSGDPAKDEPPKPPEGVHTKQEQPRYSQMMASLVDQVKKEVGDKPDDWYSSYSHGIEGHHTKVRDLQKELLVKLNELEREEGRKITSDSIHTGFDKSSVSKEKEKPKPTSTSKPSKKSASTAETVEVLNPSSTNPSALTRNDSALSSGAEADIDEPLAANEDAGSDDDEHIEPSALGREFAHIKLGDYKTSLRFISEHREIVTEAEQDGLLMEAFTAQQETNAPYAQQCVHQALLLQYCRSLGKDGVGLFFTRIQTPGHQAQKVFQEDVASTYNRIANRVKELKEQHKDSADGAGGVEQIQLHAVEPGTQIHINIPQAGSEDKVEIEAREIFEGFPPGLRKALESGSLDRVNEVLGKMSVEEAEEVVGKLGDAGMLSLEQGVIDGTTEEGQNKLKELEEQAAKEKQEAQKAQDGKPVEEVEVADPD